jgi:hypothetical protein
MPFEIWLKSLPEDSTVHVQADLDALRVDPFPFLEAQQTTFQIERLSIHLGAHPTLIRQAAIRYSLYVRQLDALQEGEKNIRGLCAHQCPRPPVGCCNGQHHVILSFSDVMSARPTQNALLLAHVLTGLQQREQAHALLRGRLLRPDYCSRLTTTGCSLRMFKSPRCIHYLCPRITGAITAAHGDQAYAFLAAMQETGNQIIHDLNDFTSASVISTANALFRR